MKTPREILFERHRAVLPKLDAIRCEVVAGLNCVGQASRLSPSEETKKSETGRMPVLRLLWRELIWPSRRTWAGLAAIWLLLAAVNLSQRDHSPAGSIAVAAPMMSFQEQQRWLNELLADRSPPLNADRPKTFLPQPSSERRFELLTI